MAQREIIVRTYFGEIGVNREDYDLLNVLLEPLEEMYGCVNVNDKIVIDIGAYIGDTALYFIHRGARKVYVFEPVEKFYRYLLRNIARNNLEDRIIAFNYGAWFRDTVIRTNIMGGATGLRIDYNHPYVDLEVRSLKDILKIVHEREGVIDLVKMDCEGCEYSLLRLDEELLRLPKHYIVEIHGAELLIIDVMVHGGFKVEKIRQIHDLVSIYLFKNE
jgi:FkbM family methyltransferase